MSATVPFSFFFFHFQKFLKTGCWDDKNKIDPSKNLPWREGHEKHSSNRLWAVEGKALQTDKQYRFTKSEEMERELKVPHLFFLIEKLLLSLYIQGNSRMWESSFRM